MIAVEEALADKLADSTLTTLGSKGVFRHRAPEGTGHPHITFAKVAGPEEYTKKLRARSNLVYQVKVIDEGHDQTDADAIRDQIDVLLFDVELDVSPRAWQGTRRMDTFDFEEESDGMTFQHVGANYRISVG